MKYALNVAAVYQYTMTQSSTMTALMHVHRVLLESLDANVIRSAALHTSGAAGTSGLYALKWRRLCISFKTASFEPVA